MPKQYLRVTKYKILRRDILRNLWSNRIATCRKLFFIAVCLFQIFFISPTYADFINGGFESAYTPDSTTCSPITGWTQTGYYFNGTGSSNPTSINDINLQSTGGTNIKFCGVTDIIIGTTQTIDDYFLYGATPTPTLLLPIVATQSAMINLRSIDTPLTKVGTSNPVTGWTNIASQATSMSQQMTVQTSDVDPSDGKVHIRFIAAPVLQNPAHAANQQPFTAIQLNNITTGRIGSNPLFFQWNYGGQAGVPWQSLTAAGTNTGSASNYQYTNLQSYDISPGNAFIHVGDVIELIVLASGCSPGGHDGHIYLDEVHTYIPPVLWVSATGPISSTPGSNITYTYTYTNNSTSAVNNVQVVANMPQQGNGTAQSTTYVSVTTPTVGTSPSCSGTSPVTCSIGTLQPGQTGTFQLTVNIPSGWGLSTGPVNNGDYPISGTGVNPLLGPLVQTNLVAPSELSNLIANTSGLPTTATVGQPYSGTFSCSNVPTSTATGDAANASCDIVNLPVGLSETGCTISPSNNPWTEPATIPSGQTVTCSVGGTPTTVSTVTATATTNSANNSNSTTNQSSVTINVTGSQYLVTPSGDGHESISPNTVQTVNPGSTLSFIVTPNTGYTLSNTIGGTCPIGAWIGSQYTTGAINASCTVSFSAVPTIPATLNGLPILSPAVVCCGRPVLLGPLPINGPGITTYTVTSRTGNVSCFIGHSGTQTYLKMNGSNGSCTIVGSKGGILSAPLTIVTP